MRFDILTLFPEMFTGPLTESIIKRAVQAGYISIELHNIREYTTDRHRTTDDAPYGGGAGMVMKAEPLAAAIRAVTARSPAGAGSPAHPHVILLSPAGERFSQPLAETLAGQQQLVLVCGRYEGVDERVVEALVDRQLSIGDYVLTGGELGAMVVLDAVARLVPGVLDEQSTLEESHSDSLLEYPHYTRPAVWEGREVPAVLLSGHHGQVAAWRHRERLRRTFERRPDLLAHANLDRADREFLQSLGWQPPARPA
ncbi:MAG TPA: tRNA (guanosine(37)-N1)-methyltransferase TrmD [Roseiflexaceae bacterium]|nr:tRNA (guanosine(37)-N1)-methyltransferase TrmD [Roseiflexaceae bacterium]